MRLLRICGRLRKPCYPWLSSRRPHTRGCFSLDFIRRPHIADHRGPGDPYLRRSPGSVVAAASRDPRFGSLGPGQRHGSRRPGADRCQRGHPGNFLPDPGPGPDHRSLHRRLERLSRLSRPSGAVDPLAFTAAVRAGAADRPGSGRTFPAPAVHQQRLGDIWLFRTDRL